MGWRGRHGQSSATASPSRFARATSGYAQTLEYWVAHDGASPFTWDDDVVPYRYRPTRMVGYAADRAASLAARGITPS